MEPRTSSVAEASGRGARGLLGNVGLRVVEVSTHHALRTARLVLRRLRESDRPEFVRVVEESREDLSKGLSLMRPNESGDSFFDRQMSLLEVSERSGTAWRRVAVSDDGRIAGCVALFSISRGLTFEADANWWIARDQRGAGLATEAVGAMLEIAFAELPGGLGLHAVHALIRPENAASEAVATRAGFVRSGVQPVRVRVGQTWVAHHVWTRRLVY